jgi:hypothetical protein
MKPLNRLVVSLPNFGHSTSRSASDLTSGQSSSSVDRLLPEILLAMAELATDILLPLGHRPLKRIGALKERRDRRLRSTSSRLL